jgi:hypothetical protein
MRQYPAHHNLNNQQLKQDFKYLIGKVSVAGCLGYDVLVYRKRGINSIYRFQLLVV